MMRAILVFLLVYTQLLSAQTLNDGLVAHYAFNGNANDESGNSNNAINVGTVRYVDGIVSEARQFINDGINKEYLNIPNVISLDEYAISFWVKLTDVSVHNSIISFNSASDWTKSDLWIYSSTKRIAVIQSGQDLRTDNYGHIGYYPLGENFLSSDTLVNDTYNNVTLNYKNNTLSIYLNSEFYVQYENVDPIPNNLGTGYVGITPHYNNNLLYQLDGDIDELRFYDRILTNEEITELYNIGTCHYIVYDTVTTYVSQEMPEDSIVAFYPFNGNANDESKNNYNGVVNGATLTTDRFGNENSAYEFDGVNDYIEFPSDFDLQERTISVWFLSNQYLSTQRIFYSDHPGLKYSSTTIDLEYAEVQDKNIVRFICGGGQAEVLIDTIKQDEWFHALISINNNVVKAYLNGHKVGETSFVNHHSVDGYSSAFVGCNRNKDHYFFGGKVDDIRIYNKALSATEAKMLYYEGKSLEEIVNDNFVYDTITNYIYDSISVTDTLIIDVLLSDAQPVELSSIKIYPNPTNDKVNILLDDKILNQSFNIRIVNEIGTLIFESVGLQENNYELDISQFGAEGLYLVQILNPNGIVINTRKIILQ